MVISRKVVSSTTVALLAVVLAWALNRYAGIVLTTEQAMAAAAVLVGLAGYATKEDARVAAELKLKGRHRQISVGEAWDRHEQAMAEADRLHDTASLPAVPR